MVFGQTVPDAACGRDIRYRKSVCERADEKSEKGVRNTARLDGSASGATFKLGVDKRNRLADGRVYRQIAGV